MWLTPKDYKDYLDFAKETGIVYFRVDLPKLLDEIYMDAEEITGLTFDELNDRCISDYQSFIKSCPQDMPFEQYLDQELYPDIVWYRKVLLGLHEYFLNN